MSRDAIEVGAFTWNRIRRLYEDNAHAHWSRCEAQGLRCPQEVFVQFFHEPANNADFAAIVRRVDWGRVRWELQEITGSALRDVRVDRGYQFALDEARARATQHGIVDDRQQVVEQWAMAKSWIVPPVAVANTLLGGGSGLALLIGFTRLGNLLGLLDRGDVPEAQKHLVWLGGS